MQGNPRETSRIKSKRTRPCLPWLGVVLSAEDLREKLCQVSRDLPGGPVAKSPSFQHRGPDSIPGRGTRSRMQQ